VIGSLVTRFASRLRFPTLFAIVAGLFLVDLFVPDVVPFFDEVMLALGTLLLGSLRKRRGSEVPAAAAADQREGN
jgi:hypothetical protein